MPKKPLEAIWEQQGGLAQNLLGVAEWDSIA
jgi:hypothetical protein